MLYHNQRNFKGVPYPSGPTSTADIASAGCGVCSISNVLLFFGIDVPPPQLGQIFIKEGFRVPAGTNMRMASRWVAKSYKNIKVREISDEKVLAEGLMAGGIAIANVDGDEGAKGVFSDSGHFINVLSAVGSSFICFDVGYYKGKYDTAYRKPLVTLQTDSRGNTTQLVTADTLSLDTFNRNPNYYLFYKEQEAMNDTNKPSDWAKEAWEKSVKAGVLDGNNPQGQLTREQLAVILVRLGLVK